MGQDFPIGVWKKEKQGRGMTVWHNLVDSVGRCLFEVASPEAIVDFYVRPGFLLEKLKTVGVEHGCNEYIFRRT